MSYAKGFRAGFDFNDLKDSVGLSGTKPFIRHLENSLGLHGFNGLGRAQGTNALGAALVLGGSALLGGGGAGAGGAGGGVSTSLDAGGSSASNWVRMAQQFGAGQQQPQKQELDQEEPDLRYDPNAYLQYSSKTVKTHADDVPNVDLTNPIDRNGAEILAIQELSKEIEAVSKRVAQLKRAK